MVIFTFLFDRGIAKRASQMEFPIPSFRSRRLLPWGLFVAALNQGSRSLTSNNNMVTKIYFPRLILPMSSVLCGVGGFCDCLRYV